MAPGRNSWSALLYLTQTGIIAHPDPGIPHAVIADDVFEGMFIPAGSVVLGNIWSILHDPAVFPDPETFDPAHFISVEEGGTYPLNGVKTGKQVQPPFPQTAFGFGRRVCPGRELAKTSVWLGVASVLSAFDISAAKDEKGRDIPISGAWSSGLVGYPPPFKCVFKPRGQKALETVMATTNEQSR